MGLMLQAGEMSVKYYTPGLILKFRESADVEDKCRILQKLHKPGMSELPDFPDIYLMSWEVLRVTMCHDESGMSVTYELLLLDDLGGDAGFEVLKTDKGEIFEDM